MDIVLHGFTEHKELMTAITHQTNIDFDNLLTAILNVKNHGNYDIATLHVIYILKIYL
jgi:hypothetical protein